MSKRARSSSSSLPSSDDEIDEDKAAPKDDWLVYNPDLRSEDCLVSDSDEDEKAELAQLIADAAKGSAKFTRMITTDVAPFTLQLHVSRRTTPWCKYPDVVLSVDSTLKGDPALAAGPTMSFATRRITIATLFCMISARLRAMPSVGLTPHEEFEVRLVDDPTQAPLGTNDMKISKLGIGPDTHLYVAIVPWEDDANFEPPRKKKRVSLDTPK